MSSNNVEVEIKLRVPTPSFAEELLASKGFTIVRPRVFEANVVYDSPERQLFSRGSLLRVRQAGSQNTLTLKAASPGTRHKTRHEWEVSVSDAAVLDVILGQLGYACVFRYEKFRTEFHRTGDPGTALLDETPLGTFMELEGAPEWIDQTATELGFRPDDYITSSYGSLYRSHCAVTGIEPTNMVFNDTVERESSPSNK